MAVVVCSFLGFLFLRCARVCWYLAVPSNACILFIFSAAANVSESPNVFG